jgi:hypothetical protein
MREGAGRLQSGGGGNATGWRSECLMSDADDAGDVTGSTVGIPGALDGACVERYELAQIDAWLVRHPR